MSNIEKVRVLVVDDAFFMRNYIGGILEEAGYEVCGEATNAPEAVARYKELNPDMVTMDIIMPRIEELDGIGAIGAIVDHDAAAKIVVISALGEEALIKKALSCGAKGFIIKPFKADKLINLLESIA